MKKLLKALILLAIGGLIYVGIEMAWRGRSHWTMFLVGGVCFVLVGGLNDWYPWELSILFQMLISAAIITLVEFLAGMVLNVWLGLGIWDYSGLPCNIMGQVCLLYTGIWFLLSLPAIIMDDYLRWMLFGEQYPEYHIKTRGTQV